MGPTQQRVLNLKLRGHVGNEMMFDAAGIRRYW
jgi:hypothetical protein